MVSQRPCWKTPHQLEFMTWINQALRPDGEITYGCFDELVGVRSSADDRDAAVGKTRRWSGARVDGLVATDPRWGGGVQFHQTGTSHHLYFRLVREREREGSENLEGKDDLWREIAVINGEWVVFFFTLESPRVGGKSCNWTIWLRIYQTTTPLYVSVLWLPVKLRCYPLRLA